jgi:hypothetical protein
VAELSRKPGTELEKAYRIKVKVKGMVDLQNSLLDIPPIYS